MKNNFPFRPHWKKPEEPKAAPETSQYLPRAVELTVEQHKPEEGLRVLLEGFAHASIPFAGVLFALLALIFSRFIAESKRIKDDNDSII